MKQLPSQPAVRPPSPCRKVGSAALRRTPGCRNRLLPRTVTNRRVLPSVSSSFHTTRPLVIADGKAVVHPIQILIDESGAGHILAAGAGAAGKRGIAGGIVEGDRVAGDVLVDKADRPVAE